MLATPTAAVPTGASWVHEIKWDGMRLLADVSERGVRLSARSEADATARFPELAALAGVADDVLLDGEVVVLDQGVPSFGALSERIHIARADVAARLAAARPVTYVVFDLLRIGGRPLLDQPWSVRRALLERLDLPSVPGPWVVPEPYDDGEALLRATAEQGLEGVVSKLRASTYQPGVRSRDWLKRPHRATLSVVVGGWRPETGSPGRLGALLVGTPVTTDSRGGDPGALRLRFDGRVGSGLAGRAGETLLAHLRSLVVDDSPFVDPLPREDATGATWVVPQVVVDVRSLGRARGGRLRQPSYVGVRDDLVAADLVTQDPVTQDPVTQDPGAHGPGAPDDVPDSSAGDAAPAGLDARQVSDDDLGDDLGDGEVSGG